MKCKINLLHGTVNSGMTISVIPNGFLKSPIRNIFGVLNSLNLSLLAEITQLFNVQDKLSEFKKWCKWLSLLACFSTFDFPHQREKSETFVRLTF